MTMSDMNFKKRTPVATWRMILPPRKGSGISFTRLHLKEPVQVGGGCRPRSQGQTWPRLMHITAFLSAILVSQCGDFQVMFQGRIPSIPQRGFWGQGGVPPAEGGVGGQGNLLLTSGCHLFPPWGSVRFHLRKAIQKGGETISGVENL